jgi:hypothetical protein
MNGAEFSTKPVDKFVDEPRDAGFFSSLQLLSIKSIKI